MSIANEILDAAYRGNKVARDIVEEIVVNATIGNLTGEIIDKIAEVRKNGYPEILSCDLEQFRMD